VNLPGTVAESTEDGYAVQVRLHLIPALGRKRLAQLTVADLDRLWKAKRDAGYSSNSVRLMRTVLRRALGQAVREGIVPRNVAGLSTAPRVRARQAEAQIAAGSSWQDHGLIFASEVGTPMDPDNFSHSFARLCEQSGLGTGTHTSCATRGPR
jgi:hypothetical protein